MPARGGERGGAGRNGAGARLAAAARGPERAKAGGLGQVSRRGGAGAAGGGADTGAAGPRQPVPGLTGAGTARAFTRRGLCLALCCFPDVSSLSLPLPLPCTAPRFPEHPPHPRPLSQPRSSGCITPVAPSHSGAVPASLCLPVPAAPAVLVSEGILRGPGGSGGPGLMLCPRPGHTAHVLLMAIPMQSWPCVCCMQRVLCVYVQPYLPLPYEGPCCLAILTL